METEKKTKEVVKDLIVINNDRYQGYQKAAEETKDADLKEMFNKFSEQSAGFAGELRKFVNDAEEQPKYDETKNTGKLYRVWMDVKAAMSNNDRKAVLTSCEFGEDVAKKHYDEALECADDLEASALAEIRKQRTELQKSHDTVKAMRDSTK